MALHRLDNYVNQKHLGIDPIHNVSHYAITLDKITSGHKIG
jgi:hypothetical protein